MIEKICKVLVGVTADDDRYIIYDAEDLIERTQEDPKFVDKLLQDFSSKTWCEAYDIRGMPVWIRTSTIVRIEYKENRIRKG